MNVESFVATLIIYFLKDSISQLSSNPGFAETGWSGQAVWKAGAIISLLLILMGAKWHIYIRIVEHAFGYDIGKKITCFAADVLLCKDQGGYLKEIISFISSYAGAC